MDDAAIVQLYWDRNEQALPATAEKYGNYCISIAKNILGNQEDAEECVNDTYLNAWTAMPPHRPSTLSTFLGKITRNLAFNRYKRNTAGKRNGGALSVVLDELADCVSGKDDVEQAFDRQELVRALDAFLDTLSPSKRRIFICRYWYAESVSAIADRQGMKAGAVSMTLSRLLVPCGARRCSRARAAGQSGRHARHRRHPARQQPRDRAAQWRKSACGK